MNVSEIRLRDISVKSSSLEVVNDESEGGVYRVNFGDISLLPDNDENGNWLHTEISAVAQGYPNGIDPESGAEPAFEAKLSLVISYECNFEEEVTEKFYSDNRWFFNNFIHVAVKISLDNLFKNSAINAIDPPWSPAFIKE